MNWKNRLILFLHKMWKKVLPSRKSQRSNPKCLIISTTALGDSLWGTPVVRHFKEIFPQSSLWVLTSNLGKEVFDGNPNVDVVKVYRGIPKLFLLLLKESFDWVVIFHASQRPAIALSGFLRASRVVGTKGLCKGLEPLFTDLVDNKWKVHEIERRLSLINVFLDKPIKNYSMELFFGKEEHLQVEKILEKKSLSIDCKKIIFHPGAKEVFRCWPTQRYVELYKLIQLHTDMPVIITGTKSEAHLGKEIQQQVPQVVSLMGELSVKELAKLIEKSTVFISGDTGPMHLAFAVKTPTVSFFCAASPKLSGPLENLDIHNIKKVPLTCSPCLGKSCLDAFCLKQISALEVFKKIIPHL
jgi:ADP-heptose:LPS heptosyltransferase